jgi:eukaryotic-like serine/threonine-protein kinase
MSFPTVGQNVVGYCIEDIIYQGQVSGVYRATAPSGVPVALKLTALTGLPQVADYVAEVAYLQQLQHPQIVTIYDVGYSAEYVYLVMELIIGTTLRQRLQQAGALPTETALDIALAVAKALTAVHQQGLIHRDIKPENIMIGADGSVKLLDFDLAQYLTAATLYSDQTTPALVGTINYMAAEQIRGEGVDTRSDLFSLAIVLYEMLTGQIPFTATSVAELITLLSLPPPPLPKTFSMQFAQFFDKALAYFPRARYQNALEFQRALQLLRVAESWVDADTLPLPTPNETVAQIVQYAVENNLSDSDPSK